MNRKTRVTLLRWGIAVLLAAAFILLVVVPLYAPQPVDTIAEPEVFRSSGDNEELILENEYLVLKLDTATTHFSVTEKESGREWFSNPTDADNDKLALSNNKDMLKSTLIVNYTTSSGSVDMNNFVYSIQDGTYEVCKEENAIRVDYAVGNIGRIYMIPTAITKDDLSVLTAKMKKSDKTKVMSFYALYEPSKLASRENADELKARYPTISDQALYVLRSDVRETNKAKLEGYFASAGYTYEDYLRDGLLVAATEEKSKGPVFNVSVYYRLDGNNFITEIPYGSIRYNEDYPITGLSVLPMFGCAGQTQAGYILVPEGGGALIHYNNGKTSESPYYAGIYGWDYSEERLVAINETACSFPVFGMTGGDGAFLCMIEGAEPYASITAGVSGRVNSYNYAYAKYTVLHCAQYDIGGKSTVPVYVYEKNPPETSIIQRYCFTGSDNYMDMAAAYRARLKERYPHLNGKTATDDMPICIELIGAIDKKVVRFGLPVDRITPLTTFSEAADIMKDLSSMQINGLSIIMEGWCNGGVRQSVLTDVTPQKQLGGESGIGLVVNTARETGNEIFMSGLSCFAYRSGLLEGFRPNRDAARFLTKDVAALQDYSIAYFEPPKDGEVYYLADAAYAAENTRNLIDALNGYGADGAALRDIGFLLSGNLSPEAQTTREQVRDMEQETLSYARGRNQKIIIKNGNEYAAVYADMIREMPLHGTDYAILDEFVPFYQAVLHGIVDYTGTCINLAGDSGELLRCAEYGAGLSYVFIAADNTVVRETDYTGLYSAGYSALSEKVSRDIQRYRDEMRGINKLVMTEHCILENGVHETIYEDGTRVYVNYSAKPYSAGEITVPAEDYLVVRGGAA